MLDYGWTMVKYEEHVQNHVFEILFGIFISIQGVQRAIREGPEPILEVKMMIFFKIMI